MDYTDLFMIPMGDESETNYPVKKIIITSLLNQKIVELLKTFGSLYRLTTVFPDKNEIDIMLEATGIDISLQERTEIQYTRFGMGYLNFLDDHHNSILSVSSTEGDFHTTIDFKSILMFC